MRLLPLLVAAAATADPLAVNDVCHRFCEDGSKPSVSRRDDCPAGTGCRPTLPPGTAAFDTCAAPETCQADAPCERAFEAAGARDGWITGPAVRAYCEREGLMRSLGRETLARVWAQVDVARDTRGIQVEAFCRFLRLLESARALPGPDDPARALPEPSAPEDLGLQSSPLAANDVCYRVCWDGSKPPISRRDDCPAGTACRATQSPGLYLDNCAAPDTCQAQGDTAPVRNASDAPGSGSAAVCSATADPHLRKFVGLRCEDDGRESHGVFEPAQGALQR